MRLPFWEGGPCRGCPGWLWWSPWGSRCASPYLVSLLQAGKFNIIPTIINVGSGVALMGVVSTSPLPLDPLSTAAGEGTAQGRELSQRSRRNRSWGDQCGMGLKRTSWDFTLLWQPPGVSACLGFSFQS